MKTLLFLFVLALVVGGGIYWYRQHPNSLPLALSNLGSSQPAQNASTTTPAPVVPPTIDATWQTYRNKILNFAFQYPTKGKFAPNFNVKLLPLTSPDINQEGCYPVINARTEKKTIAGREFCRTTSEMLLPGTGTDTESWVTKYDKWYAMITFTKKYTDISQTDACGMGTATTTRCQPFDLQGYRAQVEQILMTFVNASTTPTQKP